LNISGENHCSLSLMVNPSCPFSNLDTHDVLGCRNERINAIPPLFFRTCRCTVFHQAKFFSHGGHCSVVCLSGLPFPHYHTCRFPGAG
jgi:hypothetical protein